ncbi:MAG: phosphatase PAP2 family protein, partial [Clostridiaceae bacterium]|nr:phosphatase PAP2 family protein [Clostridiaceae bacterium]
IAAIALGFLGFFILVIGVVQDYLAHEFGQFDIVVSYLAKAIFTSKWSHLMGVFKLISSIKVLVSLTILMFIWIIKSSRSKILEIQFLLLVIGGGEVLQVTLRHIFRRLGPSALSLLENSKYTFPSNQSLMAIVAYGFFAFLILRSVKRNWVKTVVLTITLFICIASGISPIFFQTEYPSDVYAGYIFGGVWLTINIILLEVYRIIPKIQL